MMYLSESWEFLKFQRRLIMAKLKYFGHGRPIGQTGYPQN